MTTYYHGSHQLFDHFVVSERATVSEEVAPVPIFVTDQRQFALLHARPQGYLYTLDVDLGRIFEGSSLYDTSTKYWPPGEEDLTPEGEELWQDIFRGHVFPGQANDEHETDELLASVIEHNWDAIEHPSFLRWLQAHGYDSARIRGEHTGNHFAVFDPARITILDVEPVGTINTKRLKSKLLR